MNVRWHCFSGALNMIVDASSWTFLFCFGLVYTSCKFVFLKMLLVRTKPLAERSGTYVYYQRSCHVQQKDQKVLTTMVCFDQVLF